MEKSKKRVKPVLKRAVGDISKTSSDLQIVKNAIARKVISLNSRIAIYKKEKAKLREKIMDLSKKERALITIKNSFKSKSQEISKKINKISGFKKELEGF